VGLAVTTSKRQLILGGMLETVGAEGYGAASVRAVLDRTGLYRQAFYDNFADKLDCYLHAYDYGIERIEALVREAAAGAVDWRQELRAGLAAVLALLDSEPDLGRALLVEVHAAGPRGLAKRDAALQRFGAYLDRARLAGEGGVSAPTIAPEAVAAGIHSVLHTRLASRRDGSYARLLPELMYIAVLPYYGVEAASRELRMDS
jgi:AcrR family transcriptional regulator